MLGLSLTNRTGIKAGILSSRVDIGIGLVRLLNRSPILRPLDAYSLGYYFYFTLLTLLTIMLRICRPHVPIKERTTQARQPRGLACAGGKVILTYTRYYISRGKRQSAFMVIGKSRGLMPDEALLLAAYGRMV